MSNPKAILARYGMDVPYVMDVKVVKNADMRPSKHGLWRWAGIHGRSDAFHFSGAPGVVW